MGRENIKNYWNHVTTRPSYKEATMMEVSFVPSTTKTSLLFLLVILLLSLIVSGILYAIGFDDFKMVLMWTFIALLVLLPSLGLCKYWSSDTKLRKILNKN